MKRILLLTRILIKGSGALNLGGDTQQKKRRFGKAGMTLLLGFVGVYMGALGVIFASGGYDLLSPVGLESLVITLAVSAASFLVFFFGLFYVMSVFYFSNDVTRILPLPFRPGEIITAKFLTTLFYEYLIVLMLLLPAMATYGIRSGAPFLFYLYALVILLLLPVIPLVLSSLVIMAIMRFAPAARNKDRFTMVSGLLALFVGLGLNFGLQAVMSRTSEADLPALLSKSAEAIASVTSRIFPGTWFANYALAKPEGIDSFLMLLLFAGLSALFFVLLYFAASLLYFKGVIGISDSPSRGRKLSDSEIAETSSAGGATGAYVLKELRILFRTPIFFMNNVLLNFMMPFIMLFPFLMNSSGDGAFTVGMIRGFMASLGDPAYLKYASYVLLGLYGFITFTCGTNGITETAISREGSCAYWMKIIPMSYRRQIFAKILTGILLSAGGAIVLLAVFTVLAAPPLWLVLLGLAVIPGAVALPNITGMAFDLYTPKIKWDNEQKAVKQNMNVLLGMLASGIFGAAVVVPPIVFAFSLAATAAYVIALPAVLSVISAYGIRSIAGRRMLRLAP